MKQAYRMTLDYQTIYQKGQKKKTDYQTFFFRLPNLYI